jgi:hypothetical protein
MKRSFFLLVCLLIVGLQASHAQTRTVRGQVTESGDGTGLAGVSVSVKGTSTGTISDVDGNYSIDVQEGSEILVFSFVGMSTQELPVGAATVIDVIMQADNINLDEVVVTALGISREKKALGY